MSKPGPKHAAGRRPAQPAAPKAEVSQLARGGALNLTGAFVSSAVNILLVVTIARGVSQSQAGRFFAATSVFLLVAMVGKLGANTGLVYFVARLRALGRPDLIAARLRTALITVLAAATLLGLAVWVLAVPLAQVVVRGDSTQTVTYLRIMAVFVPAAALADVTLAATRGYRKMRPTVMVDLLARPALQLVLTFAVLALDLPLGWLAVAWAAPYLPETIVALAWLRSVARRSRRPATSTSEAGFATSDFWRFTGPRAVTAVVHLALQRLDIILVASLRGPAQAAIYTAATRFLVVGQLGAQALGTVAQPRLSELLAVRDLAGAKSVYQVATGWVILITWPVYLLAIIFSTQFLALFGSGYGGATDVIAVLAGAMLFATMCGMVDTVLNMAGRTTWTLANSVFSLVVMVGLDLVLIPRWGILGAAVGWAASIVANNLLPLIQIVASLRLHPFGPGARRGMLLAAASFGAIPLAVRLLGGDGTRWLVAATVTATIVYIAGSYVMRRRLSIDSLRDLVRRRSVPPVIAPEEQPV
ncbi:MAG: polysaccharide biosynthesis C-terminal domain-containing protein [Mycobacteriales bacterium]